MRRALWHTKNRVLNPGREMIFIPKLPAGMLNHVFNVQLRVISSHFSIQNSYERILIFQNNKDVFHLRFFLSAAPGIRLAYGNQCIV
jgi:hypothetical protein